MALAILGLCGGAGYEMYRIYLEAGSVRRIPETIKARAQNLLADVIARAFKKAAAGAPPQTGEAGTVVVAAADV